MGFSSPGNQPFSASSLKFTVLSICFSSSLMIFLALQDVNLMMETLLRAEENIKLNLGTFVLESSKLKIIYFWSEEEKREWQTYNEREKRVSWTWGDKYWFSRGRSNRSSNVGGDSKLLWKKRTHFWLIDWRVSTLLGIQIFLSWLGEMSEMRYDIGHRWVKVIFKFLLWWFKELQYLTELSLTL